MCICRLTLACNSSEISTKLLGMPTHLDRSSLTALDPISCQLVSLLSGVDWPLASPFANSFLWVSLSNSSLAFPSGRVEISSPNPLSGFAPKQTKESCAWWTTYIVLHQPPDASLPCRNSLRRANKRKSEGLHLDWKEDVLAVPNQNDWLFPLFFLLYEAWYCPNENPTKTDLSVGFVKLFTQVFSYEANRIAKPDYHLRRTYLTNPSARARYDTRSIFFF